MSHKEFSSSTTKEKQRNSSLRNECNVSDLFSESPQPFVLCRHLVVSVVLLPEILESLLFGYQQLLLCLDLGLLPASHLLQLGHSGLRRPNGPALTASNGSRPGRRSRGSKQVVVVCVGCLLAQWLPHRLRGRTDSLGSCWEHVVPDNIHIVQMQEVQF